MLNSSATSICLRLQKYSLVLKLERKIYIYIYLRQYVSCTKRYLGMIWFKLMSQTTQYNVKVDHKNQVSKAHNIQ